MKSVLHHAVVGAVLLAAGISTPPAHAQNGTKVLFDAAHGQLVGNADWVLDEDGCGNVPRFPTPAQSGITQSTSGTYWNGAYSSYGVALAKAGYQLESLPPGSTFTYGTTAAQDLRNYNVVVIPEPNKRFTSAEATALRNFVAGGGGLFMIADHWNSDRDNDGWDSPEIFNDLMVNTTWGLHFQVSGESDNNFTSDPDAAYTRDTSSPLVYTGPFGAARSGLGLSIHGGTSIRLDLTQNPTAKGHVWIAGATVDTATRITLASALVGSGGRLVAIGDSGPGEDITDGCSDTTYDDFNLTNRDNATLLLNSVAWLAGAGSAADTTPPSIPADLSASAVSSSQVDLSWSAAQDNIGVTDYNVYRSLDGTNYSALVNTTSTSYADAGLSPSTAYWYRVSALDAANNESAPSSAASATTAAASTPGQVIINEILANEPGSNTAGEFVELVNVGGSAVSLDGWTLSDATGVRHTFGAGTTLAAGKAIVVFGGAAGIPAGLTNAVAASTGTLGLGNSGDTVTVRSASAATVDSFTYPSSLSGTDGVSMNRSPDASASGTFVLHTALSALASSPGTRSSGGAY